MSTRKPPSIRALEEIRDSLIKQVRDMYNADSKYTCESYIYYPRTPTHDALNKSKREVIDRISKEVENYVVNKYSKYGIVAVPLCHRKDASGNDRLEIDLKVKVFPECEILERDAKNIDAEFNAKVKSVHDWYYKSLRAIAAKESFPEAPKF